MTKKYLIVSGRVVSKTDGQIHYITSRALMALYRVDPGECMIYNPHQCQHQHDTPERLAKTHNLIILEPRYDGNYVRPEPT